MKSPGFHALSEIHQISWNQVDFMKSGGFHDAKWAKDRWSYFLFKTYNNIKLTVVTMLELRKV